MAFDGHGGAAAGESRDGLLFGFPAIITNQSSQSGQRHRILVQPPNRADDFS